MKKIIIVIVFLFSSCAVTKTQNTYANLETRIDYYTSDNTKKLDFPFSDATIVNNVIYVVGQVGNLPGNTKVVPGGIKEETIQTMKNIERILLALGSSMDKVFKWTCMLSDISEWAEMSQEYNKFFAEDKRPSRSAFAGSGLALS